MSDFDHIGLQIYDLSPRSISMQRLADYMQQFAKLLGSPEHVQFGAIAEGSLLLEARVSGEDRHLVYDRVRSAPSSSGKRDAVLAFRRLNAMLSEDHTSAELPLPGGSVVNFPGIALTEPEIGPVSDATTIQGVLTRIQLQSGGKIVGLTLRQQNGSMVSGETDELLGRNLARHFGEVVRLSGQGRWRCVPNIGWSLDSFCINSFEVPAPGSLVDALSDARTYLSPGDGERMLRNLRELNSE